MTDKSNNPRLFISYCWASPEHEEWVLNLATELCDSGVDVTLDKWDLKEGHDANAFMEKMVTDPDIKKVALICDKTYANKADKRSGGVGTETQIISAEVYAKEDQEKFVAVLAERDENGKAILPTYYKSRIYIDLSDQDLYAKNFEQLLRWIHDKPLHIKPEIGKKPTFLDDGSSVSLGTSSLFRRALEAIRNNKDYANGALNEYFEIFIKNLENFRITPAEVEFDDQVINSIEQFIPYRNEVIEIFLALALYRNNADTHKQTHRFIEGLLPYLSRPKHISTYKDWDFDNFYFIVHEIFLYAIACFLKHECFDAAAYLMRHFYYVENTEYSEKLMPFSDIRHYMKSLESRNTRLNLRRISLRADLLHQRSNASGLSDSQLMQADFILYIRDCMDVIREEDRYQYWWPETLLYLDRHDSAFEIFKRAQSKEYFDQIKCLFDINKKEDIEPLMQAYREEKLKSPQWEFHSIYPDKLMGYESLATKP